MEIAGRVDSGATETVMPETTVAGVKDITAGPAHLRGVEYQVADGTMIPNLGERRFVGYTEDGAAN